LGHEKLRDRLNNISHQGILAELGLKDVQTQKAIIQAGLDLRMNQF
jgi:hypothetical protein